MENFNHQSKSASTIIKLNLSNLNIQTIPKCFKCLTGLLTLRLSSNQITKIQNLENLILLASLDLQNNQITKIQNLETLTSLKKFNLNKNRIKKFENLESLTLLTELELQNNQITKIENLEKFPLLQILYLGSNQIIKIQNIQLLFSLKTLMLAKNRLTQLSEIPKTLTINYSLQSLYLCNNLIHTIEAILYIEMPNLTYIWLNDNRISNFRALRRTYYPKLQNLLIYNNKFNQFDSFNEFKSQKLKDFKYGKYLDSSYKLQDQFQKEKSKFIFKIQIAIFAKQKQRLWNQYFDKNYFLSQIKVIRISEE